MRRPSWVLAEPANSRKSSSTPLCPGRQEILTAAVREVLLVDADLPGDDPQALLELGELTLDASLLLSQQLEALRLVARAVAHQLGELADLRQWHVGPPQLDADLQPVHVLLAVAAMPAPRTGDVLGEHQALALVEPQRVHAQPRTPRDVADAQLLFEV